MNSKELLEENRKLLLANEKLQKKAQDFDRLLVIVCEFITGANTSIDQMREFVNNKLEIKQR